MVLLLVDTQSQAVNITPELTRHISKPLPMLAATPPDNNIKNKGRRKRKGGEEKEHVLGLKRLKFF